MYSGKSAFILWRSVGFWTPTLAVTGSILVHHLYARHCHTSQVSA